MDNSLKIEASASWYRTVAIVKKAVPEAVKIKPAKHKVDHKFELCENNILLLARTLQVTQVCYVLSNYLTDSYTRKRSY